MRWQLKVVCMWTVILNMLACVTFRAPKVGSMSNVCTAVNFVHSYPMY